MTLDAKKKLCIAGIVVGTLSTIGAPVIGLLGTVVGMVREFEKLEQEARNSSTDPTVVSAAIGEVLIWFVAGVAIAVPGLLLLIVSVVRLNRLKNHQPMPSSAA